jgi:hypothetical protein
VELEDLIQVVVMTVVVVELEDIVHQDMDLVH